MQVQCTVGHNPVCAAEGISGGVFGVPEEEQLLTNPHLSTTTSPTFFVLTLVGGR